jgi:hypothetical protein
MRPAPVTQTLGEDDMDNIIERERIKEDDIGDLYLTTRARVARLAVIITCFGKINEGSETWPLTPEEMHEQLVKMGEQAAEEALTLVDGFEKCAEIWMNRAKQCGFGSEHSPASPGEQAGEVKSKEGRVESEAERRERIRTEIETMRLIIHPDMPLAAVETARQLLAGFVEESEGEE